MALTRLNVEFLLVSRVGPLLTEAGMPTYVPSAANAFFNSAIGRAIRHLGYTCVSIIAVADGDVAQVTEAQYDEFLDVAELFTLETIMGHLDDVDIRVGPRSEKYSQLAAQVERKIKRLTARNESLYDYGLAAPVGGVMTTKFAEHD